MKKSSEGSQFWGWTKFLKNSNSGDGKSFFGMPILVMKEGSSEFQSWGRIKVLKNYNSGDEKILRIPIVGINSAQDF